MVSILGSAAWAELQNVELGGSVEIYGAWYSEFYEAEGLVPHFPVPLMFRPIGANGLASAIRADGRAPQFGFVEQRTRLHVKGDFTDSVSAFIEFDSIDGWSEDFRSDYLTGVDSRADTGDDIEMYQGYIEAERVFGQPLRLRLGRQEIVLGAGWLVGNNPYANPFSGLSFDAVRWTWSTDTVEVDAWWSKLAERSPIEQDGDTDFSGLYGTYKGIEDMELSVYWLYLRDGAAIRDTQYSWLSEWIERRLGLDDYDPTNLHTAGARFAGSRGAWDWEAEAAYQFGEADALGAQFATLNFGYGDNRARWDTWACHLAVGYTLEAWKQPRRRKASAPPARLYLDFQYYDGEDNRSISFREWLNPFRRPEASVCFNRLFSDYENDSFLDCSRLSNYWILSGGCEVNLTERLSGSINAGYMQAVEPFAWPLEVRWGGHRLPVAPLFAFLDSEGDRDIGWRLDLVLAYAYSEAVSFEAGATRFFTGGALRDGVFVDDYGTTLLGGCGGEDADYAYFMTCVEF